MATPLKTPTTAEQQRRALAALLRQGLQAHPCTECGHVGYLDKYWVETPQGRVQRCLVRCLDPTKRCRP